MPIQWKVAVGVCAIVCTLVPTRAQAQSWTSTDIGDVGAAGSATRNGDVWEVTGSGADIWGTADAFQYAQGDATYRGFAIARVEDLQNTSPLAKAGLMFRDALDADSSTAVLDVKPGGGVEFMARHAAGGSMEYIGGRTMAFPAWLLLSWEAGTLHAYVSSDGDAWTLVGSASISVVKAAKIGLAVTSHDNSRLAVAHFSHVHFENTSIPSWQSADIGAVGLAGGAVEHNGEWEVRGAGGDIWGQADAFRYLYRATSGDAQHLLVRIDDQQAANAFAKTGLMLRSRLDADAASVILDVRPAGDVEFMQRAASGASMQYLAGAHVTLPAWLQLEWHGADDSGTATLTASVSQDKVHWQAVGDAVPFTLAPLYEAGVAVTSHDAGALDTAHVAGLSLLPSSVWVDDIGVTGLTGNASLDVLPDFVPLEVEASGADVWGTADSFTFVHGDGPPLAQGISSLTSITAAHPFAKAGLMWRDGLAPNAASVILDLKPDGWVEFMARMCTDCPTTFIAAAQTGGPAWLSLEHDGSTFHAVAHDDRFEQSFDLGTVSVPMSAPLAGFAVTSHDTGAIGTGVFEDPPR